MNEPVAESAADRFRMIYQSGPAWEIDTPQPAVVELVEAGQVRGRVLDAGCGTGHNAIWMACRGLEVVALDFIEPPLAIARQRAREAAVEVEWRLHDALQLDAFNERFDTVIDSGLYHVFPDAIRPKYVGGLAHVLAPGGRLHIICFSDRQPGHEGPLRISAAMLQRDLAHPWRIVEIVPTRYACRIQPAGPQHDGRGAHAWRVTAELA